MKLIKFSAIFFIAYIVLGDSLLPNPYSQKSRAIRSSINLYLVELFPSEKLDAVRDNFNSFDNLEKTKLGSKNSPL